MDDSKSCEIDMYSKHILNLFDIAPHATTGNPPVYTWIRCGEADDRTDVRIFAYCISGDHNFILSNPYG